MNLHVGRFRVIRELSVCPPAYLAEGNPGERVVLRLERRAKGAQLRSSAAAWRDVPHPNALRVVETGAIEDGFYVALEHAEGDTVSVLLRGGPLSPDRARRIAEQVCDAVDAGHERGIVHGDLTAYNVIVSPRNAVKVFFASKTRGTNDFGHPAYMAPEQIAGRPMTALSDIYSMGVLLFEMITGTVPFPRRGKIEEQLLAHLHTPPPVDDDLPFARVIRRCLAKEPGERFPTMRAVHDAL
ncbi:MAG: serine/threonine-protein kinase [Myxococcales bacterium]|nr:serine/threonine protein kinase [Myxococcales bacterium]